MRMIVVSKALERGLAGRAWPSAGGAAGLLAAAGLPVAAGAAGLGWASARGAAGAGAGVGAAWLGRAGGGALWDGGSAWIISVWNACDETGLGSACVINVWNTL